MDQTPLTRISLETFNLNLILRTHVHHSNINNQFMMRRKTRKALTHLLLFLTALFLIIYLNTPSSSSKKYPWSKITYQTSSHSLPAANGVCPGLTSSSKPVLVVARTQRDDQAWLKQLEDKYHLCIYTADAPHDPKRSELQVPANRGHEAMGYLTFIIDNYNSIPKAGAVFIHGSRKAWHNDAPDYDNAHLLSILNIKRALEEGGGYHNLRCDWSISMCDPEAKAQGGMEVGMQARLVPWDTRAVSDAALPAGLASLFGENGRLERNDPVRAQCCAQFVVGRENLWGHGREEYVAIRQWLLDGVKGGNAAAAPVDDKVAGRILSYVWHILFMKREEDRDGIELGRLNREACPSAEECYCRLYGRCGLGGCTPGRCRGQYSLPPNLQLPAEDVKDL